MKKTKVKVKNLREGDICNLGMFMGFVFNEDEDIITDLMFKDISGRVLSASQRTQDCDDGRDISDDEITVLE